MKSEGRAGRVEFDFALHEAHDINHLSLLAGNSIPREQRLNMFSLINSLQEESRAPGAGGAGLELVARQGAAGGPEAALMKK